MLSLIIQPFALWSLALLHYVFQWVWHQSVSVRIFCVTSVTLVLQTRRGMLDMSCKTCVIVRAPSSDVWFIIIRGFWKTSIIILVINTISVACKWPLYLAEKEICFFWYSAKVSCWYKNRKEPQITLSAMSKCATSTRVSFSNTKEPGNGVTQLKISNYNNTINYIQITNYDCTQCPLL